MLLSPDSNWTWFATEDAVEGHHFLFFGCATGTCLHRNAFSMMHRCYHGIGGGHEGRHPEEDSP